MIVVRTRQVMLTGQDFGRFPSRHANWQIRLPASITVSRRA